MQIEVIAQAVGNTEIKPRTANVQRNRANAGCNSDQTISDYYKVNVLFPFVDHVIQQIDSRFSQRWQRALSWLTMSIDTRDQIEILKYYKKSLLWRNPPISQ